MRRLSGNKSRSGVAPQRWTVWDKPAKTLAIPSDEPVEPVNEPRESERAQAAAKGSCELDLGEHQDTRPSISSNWRAITQHEPPTFLASVVRHRDQQKAGLHIGERQECEGLAPIERGDDPRRPAAKPSATSVEKNRTRQVCRGRQTRIQVAAPSEEGRWTQRLFVGG